MTELKERDLGSCEKGIEIITEALIALEKVFVLLSASCR